MQHIHNPAVTGYICSFAMDVFLVEKTKTGKVGKTGCNIRTNFRENSPRREEFGPAGAGAKESIERIFTERFGETGAGGLKGESTKIKVKKQNIPLFLLPNL